VITGMGEAVAQFFGRSRCLHLLEHMPVLIGQLDNKLCHRSWLRLCWNSTGFLRDGSNLRVSVTTATRRGEWLNRSWHLQAVQNG
jgi:hypothetical protein